jgi:hypothetical protein
MKIWQAELSMFKGWGEQSKDEDQKSGFTGAGN